MIRLLPNPDRPSPDGNLNAAHPHTVAGDKLHPDVDFSTIAQLTPGLSGAELANVVNEAALLAVRAASDAVGPEHFAAALGRVTAQHARSCAADQAYRSPSVGGGPTNLLLPN